MQENADFGEAKDGGRQTDLLTYEDEYDSDSAADEPAPEILTVAGSAAGARPASGRSSKAKQRSGAAEAAEEGVDGEGAAEGDEAPSVAETEPAAKRLKATAGNRFNVELAVRCVFVHLSHRMEWP